MNSQIKLILITILMTGAPSLAVPSSAKSVKPKDLATDSAHCKISYNDLKLERGLKRKCKSEKVETDYFSLDDTSAPLVQNQTFKIGARSYLATRWQTGSSQEIVIFDLGKEKGDPAFRVVSEGPSSYSYDSKTKRIKISTVTREEAAAASPAESKVYYWPATESAE